ncbi:acyl-CoA dehydrogenase [Piscinibacter sp.]|uniref:acyl-CoA dehydrogenase n=1 Tax=Piscinibacter sp. TaxID=1903157 RepID=UPI003783068F
MWQYEAPLRDMRYVIEDVLGLPAQWAALPAFAELDADTARAVLAEAARFATEVLAPTNANGDLEGCTLADGEVRTPRGYKEAYRAFVEAGWPALACDPAVGGQGLPQVLNAALYEMLAAANHAWTMYPGLLHGAYECLHLHASEELKQRYLGKVVSGEWLSTMCLTEAHAGSDLGLLATRATPAADGSYRLKGTKIFISGGEQDLTDNIVHLVLAKIPGPDGKLVPGTRGISLFIVPKKLVDTEGRLTGERNDVALAGLNHKLGYRGIPNTLLNFGEGKYPVRGGAGAIGYLVGKPGEGLRCMFHMMNEARIAVGLGATMLGYAGYEASLDYARNRPQGRAMGPGGKDPAQPQIPIIRHADVRRMLLAQKSWCEGALALELYCARLVDELHTGAPEAAAEAGLLLEMLTPIAKSWPSEWCLEANSLAIQVHGGYGYTRDFPVEQYWRDNRLNMIHEGTHGIQALDLLGRKVVMDGGKGLQLLAGTINATIQRALAVPELAGFANELAAALAEVGRATKAAWATGVAEEALANAVPYLQAFGHTVIAWIWLDVALCAHAKLGQGAAADDEAALRGKLAACRFFYRHDLPKVAAWLQVVASRDDTCRTMAEEGF